MRLDPVRIARQYGPQAIDRMAKFAGLVPAPELGDIPHNVQVVALKDILDRGYGKPVQTVQGDPENPVQFVIRGPMPVQSTEEWLQHVPQTIEHEATRVVDVTETDETGK